ncbi:MAG: NAD(P)-dependent oxidoreductase [Spirochaetales bacterium]|nr:NAD(P)-dependent oxidoreductase [Spirochaetales bacterium]
MRILVTGHRGRIGSVVHRRLEEAGHDVEGFDILDGRDVMDLQSLIRHMQGCQAAVHLGALMNGEDEIVFSTGVGGTWNLLQAAEACHVERIVYFSSVNALGIFRGEDKPDFLPIDETHPCRPATSYGLSKYLSEEACSVFTSRTGIATICLRPPIVWTDQRIERIRRERATDPSREWTPFWEYGCFIHVEDMARAAVCALTCPDPGHVVLLLSADDLASEELNSEELVVRHLPGVEWRGGDFKNREPFASLVDTRQAKKLLGWLPSYRWRDV